MTMTKKDKVEILMLLSALESYCLTSIDGKRCLPDYLSEDIQRLIDVLRDDVLEESHD